MKFHALELEWIKAIQNKLSNAFVDQFFILWDYVDTTYFVIALLGFVFYLFSRKDALNLLFILVASALLNMLLKAYFQLPRPCQLEPVGLIFHKSFGFPSGAAQTAAILAGFVLVKENHKILKIFTCLFSLMFCFSRIYLGVHFFSDVLGGLLVGSFLVWGYLRYIRFFQAHWHWLALFFSVVCLLLENPLLYRIAALMFGLFIAITFSKKDILFDSWKGRIAGLAIATLGTLLFYYIGRVYKDFRSLAFFCGGLWFVCLSHKLTKKILHWNRASKS